MVQAKLAIARTFLDSFAKLPAGIQKKVRRLTEKFEADPTSSGLNFERINHAKDGNVRSLRVDRNYRLILIQPPRGEVLLCVWVDQHDDAYDWVARKQFEVNPRSGAMQIFSVEDGERVTEEIEARETEEVEAPRLFAKVNDEELLLSGVPDALLPSVRALQHESDLDGLAPFLPEDSAELLYLLASGYGFVQALEEATRPKPVPEEVDREDFAKAVARPESRRLFRVAEDEEELQEMLDAPFEQWRFFLHPSQRKLVEWSVNGPVRVLGGAGTGKTVVLMHRAQHLAEHVFSESGDRILVTTFTRNLASDLAGTLAKLCPDAIDRLDVQNLHAWAKSFYESKVGARVRILEGAKRAELMEESTAEDSSLEMTAEFYLEEWDQVVQAQEIDSEESYLRAKRIGRGTRLSREQRRKVWAVMAEYRRRLSDADFLEWQDLIREVRLYLEAHPGQVRYRAVLADEVQDFTPCELRLLRALAPAGPNDMFLVGDAHQRIYGAMTSLGGCGIEIRGRSARLKINYRTTEQIRDQAVLVLEGLAIDDLDGGTDELTGYHSLRSGPRPSVHVFDWPDDEYAFIVETIKRWVEEVNPREICIAARTNGIADRYKQVLAEAEIRCTKIKGSASAAGSGVRLATMHRLKGLEFRRVLLCGVQAGQVPLPSGRAQHADQAGEEDHDKKERCLFYVASTRARDELVITGSGMRSEFIATSAIKQQC
jgi:superfamily I DNA/RNA helicase